VVSTVQPSLSGSSRVTGDSQARSCEGLGTKFPGLTRPGTEERLRLGGIFPCTTQAPLVHFRK
jgi:hypothetical protein